MDAFRRRPHEPEDGSDIAGLAVGVFGSIVLSVALIPLRGHVDNDVMALALVVPVLLAAVLGGRWPGAASALVAATSFDFFFTLPYQSLRIASGDDISTFVVLLIVALIAAEVGIRARRGKRAALPGEPPRAPGDLIEIFGTNLAEPPRSSWCPLVTAASSPLDTWIEVLFSLALSAESICRLAMRRRPDGKTMAGRTLTLSDRCCDAILSRGRARAR